MCCAVCPKFEECSHKNEVVDECCTSCYAYEDCDSSESEESEEDELK